MAATQPLRDVLSRKFVAYEGTYITLACRHVLLRTRETHRSKMRCPDCATSQTQDQPHD